MKHECKQCGADTGSPKRTSFCSDCAPYYGRGSQTSKWRGLIRNYGVDKQMWDAMYFEQDGKCAICEEREAVALDHCHRTGRPRGILCKLCNGMLGAMEAPGRLDRAIEYLAEGVY